jgi:spermidine/putrescine transport system ATP-binding protein
MDLRECDVELDHVSKKFGNIVAVDDVSLKVRPDTFLTFLGPSGCGKTTTLRLIGGLETPTEGKVLIKGRDVTGLPPYKRETNLVFQDFALFPHMNVLGNIGFGLRMRGVDRGEIRKRVQKALEMVGLPEAMYRKTNQLSGGQRQRVALCRALILEPAVLLLDEPLGALDAKIRKQMQVELKNLQRKLGRTFISVTHDQEEAMTMSDEIAIMNQGRIEQVGDPHTVYNKPVSRFVASFLGECNLIEVEVLGPQLGKFAVRNSHLGTFFFHPEKDWENKASQKNTCIMVRPEHITVTENIQDGMNVINGTIKTVSFKGSATEYVLAVDSMDVKFQIQGKSQYKPEDKVSISWRPEDCHLIP